jgi:hypothetical protein
MPLRQHAHRKAAAAEGGAEAARASSAARPVALQPQNGPARRVSPSRFGAAGRSFAGDPEALRLVKRASAFALKLES